MKNFNKHNIVRELKPFLFGCLTGVLCGGAIALFLVCAKIVSAFSTGVYGTAEHTLLNVICIVTLALLCCLTAATVQMLYPMSKGSGIPLSQCCARGMLRVKPLRNAAALIVGSLLSFLCGMPLGSEGPSIGVGGLIGDFVGKSAKQPSELRRYLITGGASAGLAVAFNAPLTGVAFALEETHRRFSPGILLAAISAVVPAVLTSQLIFWGLSHSPFLAAVGIHAGGAVLHFLTQAQYSDMHALVCACTAAAAVGITCGLLGAAFNQAVFAFGKLFGKIKNSVLRLLPVFVSAAVIGILLAHSTGSGEDAIGSVTENTAVWLLFTLFAVRFIMTAAASGSGATGGLFLPMIALGGLTGMLAAKVCALCGMDAKYLPNIVMISISAFYASSTRAPISAIALSIELTASFANLLPCAIAVALATAAAGVLRTQPLYERMMENLRKTAFDSDGAKNITVRGAVTNSSIAVNKRIRDVLWLYNSMVVSLDRGGTQIVPDGETSLLTGDILTVTAEKVDPAEFCDQIKDYILPIDMPAEHDAQ